MPTSLNLLKEHLIEIWRHFGRSQKINILAGLAAAVIIIIGLLIWSAKPEYRLLYSGLSLTDAAAMKDALKENKINVKLKDSGRAIYVRKKDLYSSRLQLASAGLPADDSATAGFEIFEEPKFGLTDFAQRINYQRALQGELQRTISSMEGIDSCRVMLVIPKEGLLATEEEKRSTASILLHLGQGFRLSPRQVNAMVQLVSGSVKNLDAHDVTITDQEGRLLTSNASGDPDDAFGQANEQLVAKEKVEQQLALKAQEILDRSLGVGRSIVKVNAEMNFDKEERRSEKYNKAGRVAKSEVIESESSETPAGARGGVTGIRANIPIGNPEAGTSDQGMAKTKKENIKSDYLVPTEVQHIVARGARLKQLSVSVCVEEGAVPRTPAEMEKIKNLVSSAVGLSPIGRQDIIEVVEMPFAFDGKPVEQWWNRAPFGLNRMGQWGLALIVLLVAFLVMRNVMSNLNVREEDTGVEVRQLAGETSERDDGKMLDDDGIEVLEEETVVLTPLEEQIQQIMAMTSQNPKTVAAWITSVVNQ